MLHLNGSRWHSSAFRHESLTSRSIAPLYLLFIVLCQSKFAGKPLGCTVYQKNTSRQIFKFEQLCNLTIASNTAI